MRAEEFLNSHALIYLAGIITLTAGLAIVLTHNVWAADWRILITVLGWLTRHRRHVPPDRAAPGRRPSGAACSSIPLAHRIAAADLARGRRAALLLRLSS